ncbi:TPA: hypothetical protein HIT86_004029 [Escherichia coli]|nr:hypothetical protein [Escherichia coli]EFH5165860.1 hypothetical protein [Escherichia coli]EHB7715054.1 hypothetical protein [Escherichia coli]HAH9694325.1 hypothetical protein [Escherichia coli]HAI1449410.1 hypothetical protein [Escherichia coli]
MQQIADNRVCQVLTCLPEKFVVDFANGIDVAQEHIRTAGERTFFRRLKEGLTGEGAARQNAINASLAQGVEASLRWLTEMTTSLATTNYAINRLHYLADRAGIRGLFSDADAYHLDQAFPLLMKQLELMLTSGELNPRHQHTVTLYAKGLTCKADTLSSCGYVYLAVYPTPEMKN